MTFLLKKRRRRLIAGSRTRVSNLPQAARGWLVARKASIRVITLALVKYSAPRIKLVRSRSTNPRNRQWYLKIGIGELLWSLAALTPKAHIRQCKTNVRFGPKATPTSDEILVWQMLLFSAAKTTRGAD